MACANRLGAGARDPRGRKVDRRATVAGAAAAVVAAAVVEARSAGEARRDESDRGACDGRVRLDTRVGVAACSPSDNAVMAIGSDTRTGTGSCCFGV